MRKVLLVLVLSCFWVSALWGFDGQRKGFIVGGGIGLGSTSFKEKISSPLGTSETDWTSEFAFMTDFKIGYGFTNQLELFYSDKGSWFDYFGSVALNGLGMASVNYYLRPEGPTFYLGGGVGFSTFTLPFENNSDVELGFGFYAGGGYEFTRHFAIQLDFMYGSPQDKSGGFEYTFTGFTPRVTVIGTAF
jgi:hypothetical protein